MNPTAEPNELDPMLPAAGDTFKTFNGSNVYKLLSYFATETGFYARVEQLTGAFAGEVFTWSIKSLKPNFPVVN